MPTLKARIGGAWVDVGGAGVSEVAIGPTDPGDSTTELWYDTDEPNLFDPDTARWNSAWGVVGRSFGTTAQATITAETVIAGTTVAVSTVAGRRYSITLAIAPTAGTTNSVSLVRIRRDGTALQTRAISGVVIPNSSGTVTVDFSYDETVSGTHTFDGTMALASGTGPVGNYADAGVITMMLVEDVGPVSSTAATPTYDLNPARWNSAWGTVATARKANDQLGIASGTQIDITGLSVTFTPVVGRRYRTVLSILTNLNAFANAATLVPRITDASNVTVQQRNVSAPINTSCWQPVHMELEETFASTVVVTRKARIGIDVGAGATADIYGGGTTFPAFITVDDVGPVSLASQPPAQPASVWTDLALQGGLTWRTSGHKPQYRLVGDEVQLRGLIDVASTLAAATVFTTLPVGFRPLAAISYPMITAAGGPITLLARTSGTIEVFQGMSSVPTYFGIEVVRFSVTA